MKYAEKQRESKEKEQEEFLWMDLQSKCNSS